MATVADLKVIIGANTAGFNKEMGTVQRQLKRTFDTSNLGISKGAAGIIAATGIAIAGLGVAAVKAASDMEQTRIAFTTLLKDGEKAKNFLSELEKFAATTPFELPGVLDASKRLLAFGFTAEQVIPILTAVGDSAAALGIGEAGIQRLTLAIGQMQAKGKVSAEEMLQLAEAGVPAWDMLAKKIGVDIPTAMDMASKGQVSAAEGIQAVISGMNSKFGGMMQQQSQTINGIMSNIQDSVGQTMVVIGDSIIEAFDIKPKLKNAQDAIGDFSEKVKRMGMADAIRELPSGFAGAMAVIGGAITGIAIPAIIGLIKYFGAMAMATGVISAPVIAVGAVIGGVAYAIFENWGTLTQQWDGFCNAISLATGRMAGYVQKVLGGIIYGIGWVSAGLTKIVGGVPDISAQMEAHGDALMKMADVKLAEMDAKQMMLEWKTAPVEVPTSEKTEFKNADPNNLGLESSNTSGKSKSKKGSGKAAETLQREVDRINTELNKAKDKVLEMQSEFTNFKLDIVVEGLDAYDQVYAGIDKERIQRLNALGEWQEKFSNATTEAQQLYERAMKTGDDNVIANSLAMLEKRKAAEEQAATEAKDYALMIDQQYNEERLSKYTRMQALQAALDDAKREGDFEKYLEYLSNENVAFLAQMKEKQALMQQYYDWRMEAEQTYASFAMDAANALKDGLASGVADVILNGKNAVDMIKNLGKEIVNMFIQWQIKRMAAGVLSKTLMAQETAISTGFAATETAAWTPAAIAYETIHAGSAARALTSVTSALSAGASFDLLSGAKNKNTNIFQSFGISDADWQGKTGASYQKPFQAAHGGLFSGPTHTLIGEKSYKEAVFPLVSSVYDKIFGAIASNIEVATGGGNSININNYGDINSGADYDDIMGDWSNAIVTGLRGA